MQAYKVTREYGYKHKNILKEHIEGNAVPFSIHNSVLNFSLIV